MCGVREEEAQLIVKQNLCSKAPRKEILCELCSLKAVLYCLADSAFLCEKCDKFVHGANFLSNRHIRCFLCGGCRSFTRRCRVGTLEVMIRYRRSKDQNIIL
ncbi:hypothetical protein ABFS82_13G019700 [Erythranthe guttata]